MIFLLKKSFHLNRDLNHWFKSSWFKSANPVIISKLSSHYIARTRQFWVLGLRCQGFDCQLFHYHDGVCRPGQTSVLLPPPIKSATDILTVTMMALVWTVNSKLGIFYYFTVYTDRTWKNTMKPWLSEIWHFQKFPVKLHVFLHE